MPPTPPRPSSPSRPDRPAAGSSRRRAVPLLLDPGWPYVLAGLALLVAWVLIPAANDRDALAEQLRDLESRHAALAARTGDQRRAVADLSRVVHGPLDSPDDLDAADRDLLRRLSLALLRRMPAGQTQMVVERTSHTPLVDRVVPLLDAPAPITLTSGRSVGEALPEAHATAAPSRLEELVSGPGRLWIAAAATFSLFLGLVLGTSATSAALPAGAPDESLAPAARPGPERPARTTALATAVGSAARPRARRHRPRSASDAHDGAAAPPTLPSRRTSTRKPSPTPDPSTAADNEAKIPTPDLADSAAEVVHPTDPRGDMTEQAMDGAVLEAPEIEAPIDVDSHLDPSEPEEIPAADFESIADAGSVVIPGPMPELIPGDVEADAEPPQNEPEQDLDADPGLHLHGDDVDEAAADRPSAAPDPRAAGYDDDEDEDDLDLDDDEEEVEESEDDDGFWFEDDEDDEDDEEEDDEEEDDEEEDDEDEEDEADGDEPDAEEDEDDGYEYVYVDEDGNEIEDDDAEEDEDDDAEEDESEEDDDEYEYEYVDEDGNVIDDDDELDEDEEEDAEDEEDDDDDRRP